MVVLPILWTVSLAFQQVRLLNLRGTGIIGDYSLRQLHRRADLRRLRRRAGHHARSTRCSARRCAIGDRAGRRARAAPAVPRPRAGAGRDAAAVRRAGRRRDVRVVHAAQPAVRPGEPLGHRRCSAGRSRSRSSAPARTRLLFGLRAAGLHGAAHGDRCSRPGGRSRSRSSSSPPGIEAVPGQPRGGGHASTARRRRSGSATSSCRSCCRRSRC